MAIEKEYQYCFNLISAALFHAHTEYEMSPALFEIAQKHSVLPLICGQLMKDRSLDKGGRQFCRENVFSSAINNEKLLRAQNEIIKLFEDNGIPYAILKGCSISMLYPESNLRPLGDVDVLIDPKNQKKVNELLIDNGYHFQVIQEHHMCYEKNGVHFEIHTSLSIFSEAHRGKNAARISGRAIQHLKKVEMNGSGFYVLTTEYQLLSLLTHMERHMQDTGVGLRQLCDWAVTIDRYRDEIGKNEIMLLNECGLLQFAAVLTKVCEKYLKLPPYDWGISISNKITDMMMEEICEAGSLSHISAERSLSHYFSSGADRIENSPKSVLGLYYANVVQKVKQEYPALARFPFIMPVFCVFYPVQWWWYSMKGKRAKVSSFRIFIVARKRKKLYEQLKLYR